MLTAFREEFVPYFDSENSFREVNSYVSHHPTSENQCTRLGSVPNRTVKQTVLC